MDVSAATITVNFRETQASSSNIVQKTSAGGGVTLSTSGVYITNLLYSDFTSLTNRFYYVISTIVIGGVYYADQFVVRIQGNTDEEITAASSDAVSGTTAERPTLTTDDVGFEYFDTDIDSPIWWNGSEWV